MQGPVIIDARAALEKGDVTPVLKWVKSKAESRVKAAFKKAVAARNGDAGGREKAEMRFFETLVKIHRAGEGAPYTGLKEGAPEPIIAAADKALVSGDSEEVSAEISRKVIRGIHDRFIRAQEARRHKDESVAKGREYVEAYIDYIHYIEHLHMTAEGAGGHGQEEVKEDHSEK